MAEMTDFVKNGRNRLVFRTLADKPETSHLGAGYLKKGPEGSHIDARFNHYALVLVLSGSGRYETGGRGFPLGAGSVFQRFPGELHSTYVETSTDWIEYFLTIGAPLFTRLKDLRFFHRNEPVFSIRPTGQLLESIDAFTDELEIAAEPQLPRLLVRGLSLIEHIHALSLDHRDSPLRDKIRESKRLLALSIHGDVDIKKIAKQAGLSYSSFRSRFREETGISPGRYLVSKKMEHACQLLLQSGQSIGEIAYAVGYRDPLSFSKQFKKHFGISPSEFRQKV